MNKLDEAREFAGMLRPWQGKRVRALVAVADAVIEFAGATDLVGALAWWRGEAQQNAMHDPGDDVVVDALEGLL